jgi:putative flippase GtrA
MRFLKFAVVGTANTAITFAVFNLCTGWLHMPAAGANVLGWVTGFVNSFVWNRAWTFRDRGHLTAGRVLPRFAVANLAAFGVSEAVVVGGQAFVNAVTRTAGSPSALALNAIEALAIGCSLAVNYAISTRWAFRADPRPSRDAERPGRPAQTRASR